MPSEFLALGQQGPQAWAKAYRGPGDATGAYYRALHTQWKAWVSELVPPAGHWIPQLLKLRRVGGVAAILTAGHLSADAEALLRARWAGLDTGAAGWLVAAWLEGEPIPDGALPALWTWAHMTGRPQGLLSDAARRLLQATYRDDPRRLALADLEAGRVPDALEPAAVAAWAALPLAGQVALWRAGMRSDRTLPAKVRAAWSDAAESPWLWAASGPVSPEDGVVDQFAKAGLPVQQRLLAALDREAAWSLLSAAAATRPAFQDKLVLLWPKLPPASRAQAWPLLLSAVSSRYGSVGTLLTALADDPRPLLSAPPWFGLLVESHARQRFSAGDRAALPLLSWIDQGTWRGLPASAVQDLRARCASPEQQRIFSARWARGWAENPSGALAQDSVPPFWPSVPAPVLAAFLERAGRDAFPREVPMTDAWLASSAGALSAWRALSDSEAFRGQLQGVWADPSHPLRPMTQDWYALGAEMVLAQAIIGPAAHGGDAVEVASAHFALAHLRETWLAGIRDLRQALDGIVGAVASQAPNLPAGGLVAQEARALIAALFNSVGAPPAELPPLNTAQDWRVFATLITGWRHRLRGWGETARQVAATILAPLEKLAEAKSLQDLSRLAAVLEPQGVRWADDRLGSTVAYDPARHVLLAGSAAAGTPVVVWSPGIMWNSTLLVPSKVERLAGDSEEAPS